MTGQRRVRAVTFDFWDTLVAVDGGPTTMRQDQIDGFAETLLRHGHTYERELLVEVFDANWERFEARWNANEGQYTPAPATDFIAGQLGAPLTPELRAELIDAFRVVGERADIRPAAGVEGCMAALEDAGLGLGIVCDVGLVSSPTLRDRLAGFGMLRWFDAWAFSDETGWFKPAPEAFLPVLEGLGIDDPADAAHVGDQRRTDVAGALALGMTAIRYTAYQDPPAETGPEAHHVVDDLRSIPDVLGLG